MNNIQKEGFIYQSINVNYIFYNKQKNMYIHLNIYLKHFAISQTVKCTLKPSQFQKYSKYVLNIELKVVKFAIL